MSNTSKILLIGTIIISTGIIIFGTELINAKRNKKNDKGN